MEKTKFTGTGFKKLVGEVRFKNGRKEKTSFCIIDAQSVKNTDTAEEKAMIQGRKRHIIVETLGLVITAEVHSASIQDRDGATNLFVQAKCKAPTLRKFLLTDGYKAKSMFVGNWMFANDYQEIG
ncbi:IS5 family transposase [Trichonephila inaurata madagascariensis]|uniref:IS5 family transposase n=1 Tax=Trichonephila inaurata madagascariensis TaxID=2747483 RepID=A0A8X7CI57_9ARAC|nr:IS5 family transposase [Trichonephila inaurata madagascariensis]